MSLPRTTLQRLAPRTFRSGALDSIRAAILDGTLAAGSPLVERRLAEELGISRAPVREALSKLEEEGLVVTIPYKGTYVTTVSPGTMEEILTLRPLLERFAAERAVARLQSADIGTFRRLLTELRAAAGQERVAPFEELHLAFHRQLYVLADHALLLQSWSLMETQLRLYLRLHQRTYESLETYAETHVELIELIEARDGQALSEHLVRHIGANADLLLRGRRAEPGSSSEDDRASVSATHSSAGSYALPGISPPSGSV